MNTFSNGTEGSAEIRRNILKISGKTAHILQTVILFLYKSGQFLEYYNQRNLQICRFVRIKENFIGTYNFDFCFN